MKYIITKDGIHLRKIFDKECSNEEWESLGYSIIKQADTIKELCDRFVLRGVDVIILNKDNTQYRFEGEAEWYDITDTQIRIGVYGAVWTDKGLIYVAKMNEQGELVLL